MLNNMSDEDIYQELSHWFDSRRIEKRIKDAEVARRSGVTRKIITNFRTGASSITLGTFIKLLRGIDELGALEALLSQEPVFRPSQKQGETKPKRVREAKKKDSVFQWGDEL